MDWGFVTAHVWQLIAQLALLIGSAFFSGSETALFSLSRSQIIRLRNGGPAARAAAALMAKPRKLLSTLLLGNMIVNTTFASIAAVLVFDLEAAGAPAWAGGAISLGLLLALILLGEVSPKFIAMALGERVAVLAGPPLVLIQRVLAPLLWFLQNAIVLPLTRIATPSAGASRVTDVTTQELRALLNLSARRGILDHDANTLLQEILELKDIHVGDIMVPRVDMIAFDVNRPRAELLELFRKTRLRRVPAYDGNIDEMLGLVHAKRVVLSPDLPIRSLVTKASFVPLLANLERVLVQFRVTRTQLAIVVDEYGGTAGMVTLEDVLEEIVGDIPDPHQTNHIQAVQRLSDHEYLIAGNLAIHEWPDFLKIRLPSRRISTIGGFVLSLLGHIPRLGEQATYRNLRFTVESMHGRRIDRLRLELLEGVR